MRGGEGDVGGGGRGRGKGATAWLKATHSDTATER